MFSVRYSSISADIYSTNVTVEIYIQGGIHGANGIGIQNYFKVYPVQMVVSVPRLKKENRDSEQQRQKSSQKSFFDILLDKTEEEKAPDDCYTVTYDRNSRLRTFQYCRKEYTF